MRRNLVICCDGTGNQITTHPTNVLQLWSALARDDDQVGFYDPGVGTLGDPRILNPWRRQLHKRLDAAIGFSIRENFVEAYSFLAREFQPDDRVFLFGFSRGAYTARAVAGAMHRFGLVHPEHQNLVAYVWRTYSNDDRDEDDDTLFATAARFRKRFAREVRIHFLGVWDTVSSFGLVTSFRTLPDTRANASIDTVRHAVAIDEHRACFRLNRFEPGVAGQDLEEVWFAGCHSDVGGGYPEEESELARVALRWMMRHGAEHGLRFDAERCREVLSDPQPDGCGMMHESLRGWWKLLEFLPQRRFTYKKKRLTWHVPNLFRRRKVKQGGLVPLVHESVRERMTTEGYRPRNLPRQCHWIDDPQTSGDCP